MNTIIHSLLRQFDEATNHRWESMSEVLRDVTDAEAAWQHSSYRSVEHEDGWPLHGSIHWHVAHVAHCKRYYRDVLLARGEASRPEVTPRIAPESFVMERAALEEAHLAQRNAIAAIPDDQLDVDAGGGMSVGEFIRMTIRHDIWHASQIAVARRLYKFEGAPS